MRFLFFLAIGARLFSTVNEPLRCEIFSGYRNDRIHWHLQDPGDEGTLTYSELYRDIEYWENGLVFKAIHRDLTFFLRGAYGAFGRGTLFQHYKNSPFASEPHRFQFQTEGWTADATGYFGYAVNLTPDRTYKAILTPLIGYLSCFEELKRNQASPSSEGSFSSSLPGVFRLVWNGFLFGGGLTFQTNGNLVCNLGYSYQLLHNRVHTKIQSTMNEISSRQSIKTSSDGNSGQTGWAQIDGLIGQFWRLGVGGQIHYFSTRVVNASIQQSGIDDISQKFKLRWTPISGWAQVSRTF